MEADLGESSDRPMLGSLLNLGYACASVTAAQHVDEEIGAAQETMNR